jgi:hypothetical protein
MDWFVDALAGGATISQGETQLPIGVGGHPHQFRSSFFAEDLQSQQIVSEKKREEK